MATSSRSLVPVVTGALAVGGSLAGLAQSELPLIPWAYAFPPVLPAGKESASLSFPRPKGELTLPGPLVQFRQPLG